MNKTFKRRTIHAGMIFSPDLRHNILYQKRKVRLSREAFWWFFFFFCGSIIESYYWPQLKYICVLPPGTGGTVNLHSDKLASWTLLISIPEAYPFSVCEMCDSLKTIYLTTVVKGKALNFVAFKEKKVSKNSALQTNWDILNSASKILQCYILLAEFNMSTLLFLLIRSL